jgi:hypothetical protein
LLDSLVRELNGHLRHGWARGPNAQFKTAAAFAMWKNGVVFQGKQPQLAPLLERIWTQLEIVPPAVGWRPDSTSDALIQTVFARVWPTDRETDATT